MIESAAVIGPGIMGSGSAQALALSSAVPAAPADESTKESG